MRTIARALAYVVGFAAAATVVAQDNARDLQDLIGVQGQQGYKQLHERGYTFIRSMDMGADEYSYWRDSRSGRCVSVRSAKGRYAAFEYAPDSKCAGGSGQSGYGGGGSWSGSGDSASRGVTLHRDLSFSGVSESFTSDVPDLRGSKIGDDQATSVSVSPGCRARLYRDLNYQGAYTDIDSSTDDLRVVKVGVNSVTSLQVRCDGGSGDSVSRGVTLHRDLSFTGVSESFTSDVPDLRGSKIGDDQATSVSVSPGCRARLYRDLNYQGAYTDIDSSTDDLRGAKVGDDSVTSLQVRCDGGSGGSGSRGVTLHRDLSFSGVSQSFTSDVPDLRGSKIGDDQATSVSVSPGCRARLYRDLNYQGAYTDIDSSTDDLRGAKVGDDSATSLQVKCDGGGGSNLWHDQWGDGVSSSTRGVTLHRDLSFTGVSETFTSDVPDLRGSGIGDDQATSVSVSRGCQARLYRDLNYEGPYTEVDSSTDDLRDSKVGNDSVTSLKVRCER